MFETKKMPDEYKDEFKREELKNNFKGLSLISLILLVVEIFIYTIRDKFYGTENIILIFIISSLILVPTILLVRKKIDQIWIKIPQLVQLIYSYSVIFFTIGIFLYSQSKVDVSYIYVMAILAISFFLSMSIFEQILLLLPTYTLMIIFLPKFQQDSKIIFVIAINMFIVNIIAWGLGYLITNLRKEAFMHRKILYQKNLLLEELIKKDAMTGLYNHKASFKKLKKEMDYSDRIGNPLSLIILDIDDFKKINDTYGHLAGDEVLKQLSDIMRNNTRKIDTVGRYGGEEFIIILPGTDLEGAKNLAKRIQLALSLASFEKDISITISGGISQYINESVDELIQKTDEKLYKAKRTGKNKFVHSI